MEFAGERHSPAGSAPFRIGREGDLIIDDNPYLHRRFLELRYEQGLWWIVNVGGQLSATVSDLERGLHAWVAPGGRMPLVMAATAIRFTAGPTNYEIEIHMANPIYEFDPVERTNDGSTTIGRLALTIDQKLMLVALAEGALHRGGPGIVELPTSSSAARRLGWTLKKFEKKIDNVCDRLSNRGVRGLKGEAGNLAANRRARLVEYALAARLVTVEDLALLDAVPEAHGLEE